MAIGYREHQTARTATSKARDMRTTHYSEYLAGYSGATMQAGLAQGTNARRDIGTPARVWNMVRP